MGTNGKTSPSFITDEKCLNMLLTRSRYGLVIVGTFDTMGSLDKNKGKGKGKGKGAKENTIIVVGAHGECIYTRCTVLQNVYRGLLEGG